MPRASTVANGPFSSRYATMAAALVAPMPGSISSIAASAVLMLTISIAAASAVSPAS